MRRDWGARVKEGIWRRRDKGDLNLPPLAHFFPGSCPILSDSPYSQNISWWCEFFSLENPYQSGLSFLDSLDFSHLGLPVPFSPPFPPPPPSPNIMIAIKLTLLRNTAPISDAYGSSSTKHSSSCLKISW